MRRQTLSVFLALCFVASSLAQTVAPQSQSPAAATPAANAMPEMAGPRTITLAKGMPVQLKLAQKLTNKTAVVGSLVELVLVEDLKIDGVVVAPKGARALGSITAGKNKENAREKAKALNFELVYMRVGAEKVPLTGDQVGEGKRDAGKVVAATVFFGVSGLVGALTSAKDFVIPEGTPLTGFVAQDTTVSVK